MLYIVGYVNSEQAAKLLSTTPTKINKLCKDGLLDGATKSGTGWKIPFASLLKYDTNIAVIVEKGQIGELPAEDNNALAILQKFSKKIEALETEVDKLKMGIFTPITETVSEHKPIDIESLFKENKFTIVGKTDSLYKISKNNNSYEVYYLTGRLIEESYFSQMTEILNNSKKLYFIVDDIKAKQNLTTTISQVIRCKYGSDAFKKFRTEGGVLAVITLQELKLSHEWPQNPIPNFKRSE